MLFFAFLSSITFAENNPRVLTNGDLSKYKKSSDNSSSQSQYRTQQAYVDDNYQTNQANYESWCEAGTKCRNRVTRANGDVKEADEKHRIAEHEYKVYRMYNGRLRNASDYFGAKSNLDNAKERLKHAEEDLSDLEAQARSKDIKPGWLRCQK